MDKLTISGEGYPGTKEYLEFAEASSHKAIEALSRAIGNNVIIHGIITTGGVVSEGSIIYNNEILPFVSSPVGETVILIEETTTAGYDTTGTGDFSTILPIWKKRYCKYGDAGDPNVVDSFPFSTLVRLQTLLSANDQLKFVHNGTLTSAFQLGGGASVFATGTFTNAEILESNAVYQRIKVTFSEILGDYVPVVNLQANMANALGGIDFTIFEQTSTSLTINLYIASEVVNYSNTFNLTLIG